MSVDVQVVMAVVVYVGALDMEAATIMVAIAKVFYSLILIRTYEKEIHKF